MPNHRPADKPEWNILGLIRWTTDYFRANEVEGPRASAEVLLAAALGLRRIDLYLQYDKPMLPDELASYKALIRRRVRGEPVAYITGEKEFWSLDFFVDRSVLIPRPETECLVEAALSAIPEDAENGKKRVLELGTGSGAVITALAKDRPGHSFTAMDRSPKALATARKNALRHLPEGAVSFFLGDWLAAVKSGAMFDVMVSNPPYVKDGEVDRLAVEIRDFEPRAALCGGPDGLDAVRVILKQAPERLAHGGTLFLEIGDRQGGAVEQAAAETGAWHPVAFIKDFAGVDRIVKAVRI